MADDKNNLRAQLLDQIGKWFDSATSDGSQDHSITIERRNFLRDEAGNIKGSSFSVKATLNIGAFTAPVEESRIVAPVGH